MGKHKRNRERNVHPTHSFLVEAEGTLQREAEAHWRRDLVRLAVLLIVVAVLVTEKGKLADWLFLALAVVETNAHTILRLVRRA